MVEKENQPGSQPGSSNAHELGSVGAGGALNSSERGDEERGGGQYNSFNKKGQEGENHPENEQSNTKMIDTIY